MKEKYKYAILCQLGAFGVLALGCLFYIIIRNYIEYEHAVFFIVISLLFFGLLSIFGTIPCLIFGFEDKNPGVIV